MQKVLMFLAQEVPEGRPFALDAQTVISICIQLFNALVLAVVLTYILYKPVKRFLDKRAAGIQDKIKNADAMMAQANELIAKYEIKIKEIEKERLEILETARLELADEKKAILDEARREARDIKNQSLEVVAADKKRLNEETRVYIIELSHMIAQKYIAQNIDDKTRDKLFADILSQLEESQWQI